MGKAGDVSACFCDATVMLRRAHSCARDHSRDVARLWPSRRRQSDLSAQRNSRVVPLDGLAFYGPAFT